MRTALAVGLVAACTNSGPEAILNPARDRYEQWIEIQPNAVCGNGTPYKFFANFSDKSDNLVVVLEPGGACWDYASCTGASGIRGAANVDGLADDHFQLAPFISPFLNRSIENVPTTTWNYVYVPYCTGDVHSADTVVTYSDDANTIEFHHDGHHATEEVVAWIDASFTHVPKLLVTGCSAGGAGSVVNYHALRRGVHAVEQGYLLDDSGPIFPSTGYSSLLHQQIRSAWQLDGIDDLPPGFTLDDMGSINTAIADEFPHDRLATTYFRRDMNYSVYSYERFYNFPPKDQILKMWDADTELLMALYDTRPNLKYFIPYWRNINESHCTTLFSFAGSDIEDHAMTLEQWVDDFIADRPVQSMEEAPVAGEDP